MEYTLLGLDINEGKEGQREFCTLEKVSRVTFSLNLEWKIKCGAGHGGSDYGRVEMV